MMRKNYLIPLQHPTSEEELVSMVSLVIPKGDRAGQHLYMASWVGLHMVHLT